MHWITLPYSGRTINIGVAQEVISGDDNTLEIRFGSDPHDWIRLAGGDARALVLHLAKVDHYLETVGETDEDES